jgi:hypothetical protein
VCRPIERGIPATAAQRGTPSLAQLGSGARLFEANQSEKRADRTRASHPVLSRRTNLRWWRAPGGASFGCALQDESARFVRTSPAVQHPVYVLMERERLVLLPTPEQPGPLEIGLQYIDHAEIRHREPCAAPAIGAVGGALLTFLVTTAVMSSSCKNSSNFGCVPAFAMVVSGATVAGGFVGGYGVRALAAKRER